MWKVLLFDVPSIISLYCRYIEINITKKPSLHTSLFTWETRLSFIRSTGPEPSIYVRLFLSVKFMPILLMQKLLSVIFSRRIKNLFLAGMKVCVCVCMCVLLLFLNEKLIVSSEWTVQNQKIFYNEFERERRR